MVLETKEIPGRKLKVLRIANPIFISLLLQSATQSYKVVKGLPSDTKVVNVKLGMGDFIEFLIESQEFNPVPFGEEIPEIEPLVVARI